MRDSILLNSGDLYFSPSQAGGNTSPITIPTKIWLNDQIVDMYNQILALQGQGGVAGKDGHEVEFKVGLFPDGAEDLPENYGIQWRWKPQPGETPEPSWKLLLWSKDLIGAQGEEGPEGPAGPVGPQGPQGISVMIKGAVNYEKDLFVLPDVAEGDGWMVRSTGDLWRCNNGFVWDSELHWDNLGHIVGPKGEKGDKGARGPKGDRGSQGEAGSISSFLLQWIVDTATNQAISYAMMDINTAINDAINDLTNQLMSMAENAATDAVEKALEDMMDEFKGEKGDKGDKGDKGKDGTSFKLVGRFDDVTAFTTNFPPSKDTVGFAAMIGPENSTELEMWAITQSTFIPGIDPIYRVQKYGKLQGPKGADATWEVSIRDTHFVETKSITVESDLPSGVAGMYIQETDSILIEGLSGSAADPKQVGFRMRMKYPIPTLVKEGDAIGTPTKDKVLSNDGEKLVWVDGGTGGGSTAKDEILLKGGDGRIWALSVGNDGRLNQDLSIETTDDVVLKVKSPNGQNWGITIDSSGKLNVSEVV